jgi:hypothetical protein
MRYETVEFLSDVEFTRCTGVQRPTFKKMIEVVETGLHDLLAGEHNWNMTEPDLFTQMARAWFTGRPLPAELQPMK